jgi:5-formyltetrahydrofolate cyclo-ligase
MSVCGCHLLIHCEKRMLRRTMLRTRRNMDPAQVEATSRRIQAAVLAHPEFLRARSVACYLSLQHEVQTGEILAACWRQGKRVCVPAFNAETNRYELVWYAREDETKRGRLNIPEPKVRQRAGAMDVDFHVVPALAYDRSGGRLGHGCGYYDRILGNWSGLKAGVAFDFQVLDKIPTASHDVPVDLVITETATYAAQR